MTFLDNFLSNMLKKFKNINISVDADTDLSYLHQKAITKRTKTVQTTDLKEKIEGMISLHKDMIEKLTRIQTESAISLPSKLEEIQTNLEKIQKNLEEIQKNLEEIQSEPNTIITKLVEIQTTLEKIQTNLKKIQSEPNTIITKLVEIQKTLVEIQTTLEEIKTKQNTNLVDDNKKLFKKTDNGYVIFSKKQFNNTEGLAEGSAEGSAEDLASLKTYKKGENYFIYGKDDNDINIYRVKSYYTLSYIVNIIYDLFDDIIIISKKSTDSTDSNDGYNKILHQYKDYNLNNFIFIYNNNNNEDINNISEARTLIDKKIQVIDKITKDDYDKIKKLIHT